MTKFLSADLFTTWSNTPIVRGLNPRTGQIWGNDDGFREMKILDANPAPLVEVDILTRAAYDGISPYTGQPDNSMSYPGGVGKFLLREAAARSVEYANGVLETISDGQYQLCGLDAFRSFQRQALGFSGLLNYHMAKLNLPSGKIEDRLENFLLAVKRANSTFCYVSALNTSNACKKLMNELRADSKFLATLEVASSVRGTTVEDDLVLFVTACANANIGRAEGLKIPFNYDASAHATGGAIDVMIVDKRTGKLMNFTPLDYPEKEALMGYLEVDDNYNLLLKDWDSNTVLSGHFAKLGYPDANCLQWGDWVLFRDLQRVLYHLAFACGWTHWSEVTCGENWHFEPGNGTPDVLTGDLVCHEDTFFQFPNSGNPAHTLQVLGRDATAVWGGRSAHEQLGIA